MNGLLRSLERQRKLRRGRKGRGEETKPDIFFIPDDLESGTTKKSWSINTHVSFEGSVVNNAAVANTQILGGHNRVLHTVQVTASGLEELQYVSLQSLKF